MQQTPERGPAVGPQVIFGCDRSGVCTLSTGLGLDLLDTRPGELVGQNLFTLYRDDPLAIEALHRVLAGSTFTVEREFRGRVLAVYYEPVRDTQGTVTGVIGVTTDVTEQRRIEREFRTARQRATLLADISTALTREILDSHALLQLAVRSVAEPVGDAGVVWLRPRGGTGLELRARWRRDGHPDLGLPDDRLAPPDVPAVEAMPDPQVVESEAGPSLRVPLRSRGLLLGVIDVTRSTHHGPFEDEEVALVRDIAERCAISLDNALLLDEQREAHEQLVKFQALADASDNLIGITDLENRLVYSNPRVREYGVDVTTQDIWATVAEAAGDPARREIRAAVEAVGRWSGDLGFSINGPELTAQLDVFRLSHPDTGAPLGTAWIAKDVTGVRATEAALRGANADLKQFKALVEASPDFIAIAGLDGAVRYVNPRGREMVGLEPDLDVSATTIADYLTPEGLKASVEVEQPAVLAQGHWEGESTLRDRRGPAIPVAIASFLMHDVETGEPFALATVQRDISERLAAETALRDLADQRQALLTRLVDVQDAERTRIAADVHDDPVQALAAVDLRLGLLKRRLEERAPDLLDAWKPLQASVVGATDRLRALLFDLEPPDLRNGLTGALCRAASEIFDGTETRWSVDGDREPDVPDAVRAIAYRIAKESLTNARKHAAADHVAVVIASRDGGIEVSVTDDGVGLGSDSVQSSPGHLGLSTMQDRAAVAGGRVSLDTPPGGGTRVTTWLPGTRVP